MLDFAYYNQMELNLCIEKVVNNKDLYFYFMFPYKFFSINIENSERNSIQFVSKNSEGNIIGYLAAYINHFDNSIENLDIINFTGKTNITFSKDVKLFFDYIFNNKGFRKIIFHVISKNPSVNLYRKLIKRLGGREVGILKRNKKLTNNEYYDEIIFEIFIDEYFKNVQI